MAFINKQEEVIKLRLTQHGKHLLSLGKLKPDSYALFDDDIIYDSRYAGVTEHQNDAQDRIKEQARRDAQHVSVGVETRYGIQTNEIEQGDRQEFVSLINKPTDIENEKVLGFPLTNMDYGTQEAPRFELSVIESEIQNSSSLRYDLLDGSRIRIPQLDFEPEHILTRDSMNVDYLSTNADPGMLIDEETLAVNPVSQKIEFLDNSFLEHTPESIEFELYEFNTAYLRENFEVEVFEILDFGTEQERLIPIKEYSHLFNIKSDLVQRVQDHSVTQMSSNGMGSAPATIYAPSPGDSSGPGGSY